MGPWQFVNPGDMTSGQMEKTEGPCALASPESWPQQDTGLETKRTKISLDFPCLSAPCEMQNWPTYPCQLPGQVNVLDFIPHPTEEATQACNNECCIQITQPVRWELRLHPGDVRL